MSHSEKYLSRIMFTSLINHYEAVKDEYNAEEDGNKIQVEFHGLLQHFRNAHECLERLKKKIKEITVNKDLMEERGVEVENLESKEIDAENLERTEEKVKDSGKIESDFSINRLEKMYLELRNDLIDTKKENNMLAKERDDLKETTKRFRPLFSPLIMKRRIKNEDNEIKKSSIKLKKLQFDDIHIELEHSVRQIRDLESEKKQNALKINHLQNTIKALSSKLWYSNDENKRLLDQVKESEITVDFLNKELDKKEKIISLKDAHLHEHETAKENQQKHLSDLYEELKRNQEDSSKKLARIMIQRDDLVININRRIEDDKILNKTINGLRTKNHTLAKKIRELKEFISEDEAQGKAARDWIEALQKELENAKDKQEKTTRYVDEVLKERDFFRSNVMKWEKVLSGLKHDIVASEEKKRLLALQLKEVNQNNLELTKKLKDEERVTSSNVEEIKTLNQIVEEKQSIIKTYEIRVDGDEQLIKELKQTLKDRTRKWQEMSDERHMFKKFYDMCKSTQVLQKTENTTLANYNDHLTDALKDGEIARRKITKTKDKLKHDNDNMKLNLRNKKKSIDRINQKMKQLSQRERKMLRITEDQEKELQSRSRQFEKMLEENKTLESKLAVKEKEILDLEEKSVIREKELLNEKRSLLRAMEDIKLLKNENQKMARTNKLLEERASMLPQMRHELMQMEQQLVDERVKTKALEETQKKQHRWTEKKTTDPDYIDMLFKNQFLQKNNLQKTDQLQKNKDEMMKKDRLIEELTVMLKRQPGENGAAKLLEFKKKITKQKDTIKALTFEINMYESLLSSHEGRLKHSEVRSSVQNRRD